MRIFGNLVMFRWKPGRELYPLAASYAAIIGLLSLATFVATPKNGALYFLCYGVFMAALVGVGVPVVWISFVEKKSITTLGVTTANWGKSLSLQLLLTIPQSAKVIESFGTLQGGKVIPLTVMALAIGFFEALYWRGWMLQALERAFGVIPAVLAGSAFYALYHIGYGMDMSEMTFLFLIGLMFSVAFLLTRSILILWPLFQPSGQFITLVKDELALPGIAVLGFAETLALMITILVFAEMRRRRRSKKAIEKNIKF